VADPVPTVAVLSAIPVEYQAVQAHLRDPRDEHHPAGTIFKLGSLPDSPWRVLVAEMGTGNPQAAIIAERAIRHFRPDLVMLVGIAGRLHTDLSLGDIVVTTKIYAVHSGKEAKTGFRPRPESWQPDHACDQRARRVAENGTWRDALPDRPRSAARVYFRPIASGEVVLDAPKSELKRRLDRDYEDAAVIEMEGAGVARACHLNNVPSEPCWIDSPVGSPRRLVTAHASSGPDSPSMNRLESSRIRIIGADSPMWWFNHACTTTAGFGSSATTRTPHHTRCRPVPRPDHHDPVIVSPPGYWPP